MSAPTRSRREPVAGHVRAEDFRHRAACREVADADLFFPAAERGPEHDAQVRAAKSLCAGCPVLAECREWALSSQADGIAGGMTDVERRRERARRRSVRVIWTATRQDGGTGEGHHGGIRAPLQISHSNAQAGTRAAEGHDPR